MNALSARKRLVLSEITGHKPPEDYAALMAAVEPSALDGENAAFLFLAAQAHNASPQDKTKAVALLIRTLKKAPTAQKRARAVMTLMRRPV